MWGRKLTYVETYTKCSASPSLPFPRKAKHSWPPEHNERLTTSFCQNLPYLLPYRRSSILMLDKPRLRAIRLRWGAPHPLQGLYLQKCRASRRIRHHLSDCHCSFNLLKLLLIANSQRSAPYSLNFHPKPWITTTKSYSQSLSPLNYLANWFDV